MSQTTLAHPVSAHTLEPSAVVLQGRDPATGHLTTWHLTPHDVNGDDELWQVERVTGFISHPAVWMQTAKETTIITRTEALELQRRVQSA